jgi:hypothetical protein
MELMWAPVKFDNVFVGWLDRTTASRLVFNNVFKKFTKTQFERNIHGGGKVWYPQWTNIDVDVGYLDLMQLKNYSILAEYLIANGKIHDIAKIYNDWRIDKTYPDLKRTVIPEGYESLDHYYLAQLKSTWDFRIRMLDAGQYLDSANDRYIPNQDLYVLDAPTKYFNAWMAAKLMHENAHFGTIWGDLDKDTLPGENRDVAHACHIAANLALPHIHPDRFHPSHLKRRKGLNAADRITDQQALIEKQLDLKLIKPEVHVLVAGEMNNDNVRRTQARLLKRH